MTLSNLIALSQKRSLVLASGSPRRVELLTNAGISFTQQIPDVHERIRPGESPEQYALRLAGEKAFAVAVRFDDANSISLGCDTIVVLGPEVLEKPESEEHAFDMLSRLSGRTHHVVSAVAFASRNGVLAAAHDSTAVSFNNLKPAQIREYIATGEPMDKAGGYGIQGMGGFLVDSIEGDIDTVVGLPMRCLDRLAGELLRQRE